MRYCCADGVPANGFLLSETRPERKRNSYWGKQILKWFWLDVLSCRGRCACRRSTSATFHIGDVPRPTNRLLPAEAERP